MQGKICIVTGANSGIGKVTAAELAAAGAKVVMVCRNAERGSAALEELRARRPSGELELMQADVSSRRSAEDFAIRFKAKHDHLDVLVNNAGIYAPKRRLTPDGHESMFAVNHLGYFIMAQLLADSLAAAPAGRIVNVASQAHRAGRIDFDNLQGEKRFRAFKQYGNTKLANVHFTYALARRLDGSRVTANCLHPGSVASGFAQDEPSALGRLVRFGSFVLISPERGARTSVYLATSPEVEGVSGRYFVRCRLRRSSKRSYDDATAEKLWTLSEEMTGLARI
jgi:retinol dehydrogenase-12